MTDSFAAWTVGIILSVFFWTFIAQMVLGDSRQQCERTASAEICAWELR